MQSRYLIGADSIYFLQLKIKLANIINGGRKSLGIVRANCTSRMSVLSYGHNEFQRLSHRRISVENYDFYLLAFC